MAEFFYFRLREALLLPKSVLPMRRQQHLSSVHPNRPRKEDGQGRSSGCIPHLYHRCPSLLQRYAQRGSGKKGGTRSKYVGVFSWSWGRA